MTLFDNRAYFVIILIYFYNHSPKYEQFRNL